MPPVRSRYFTATTACCALVALLSGCAVTEPDMSSLPPRVIYGTGAVSTYPTYPPGTVISPGYPATTYPVPGIVVPGPVDGPAAWAFGRGRRANARRRLDLGRRLLDLGLPLGLGSRALDGPVRAGPGLDCATCRFLRRPPSLPSGLLVTPRQPAGDCATHSSSAPHPSGAAG